MEVDTMTQGFRPARARRSRRAACGVTALLASAWLLVATGRALAADDAASIDAGPIQARIEADPFRLSFHDARGTLLADAPSSDPDAPGSIGFRVDGGWRQAIRVESFRQPAASSPAEMVLATDDPDGRRLALTVAKAGNGVISVEAEILGTTGDVRALGAAWQAPDGERFFGFGQRADAVEHRGAEVESYVSDGPYREDEYTGIGALLPPPGFRRRADATYFPLPWLLSSRGYGVLVENDDTAYHDLGARRAGAWSLAVQGAPVGEPALPAPRRLRVLVFAGPEPADVLTRFSRHVGRQPSTADAPWVLGPWYQPGGPVEEQAAQIAALRAADAPVSVAQTYFHYLPCGGNRTNEPARTSLLHALGVAVTTYFNPMLCESFSEPFRHATRTNALTRDADGDPFLYTYFTSRPFVVGQYDFSYGPGRRAFHQLLRDSVDDGHDGWMEDFGEYTPLDARTRAGATGSAAHNRYVVDYHCAGWDFARRQQKPVVRFQRSGWTGVARCAQVVWGGDPTTDWGYDGLVSALRSGLGMGLSGIGVWGSDIGGFFSFNGRRLDDELLTRWVQLGAVSGVMRTQRDGIRVPDYERPQVDDPAQIANWRRYAKLRTQLEPYLTAAAEEYRRTGMPLMRHLVLVAPDDPNVLDRDDELLFGPDLLAAPVLEPGARTRRAYLPAGGWIDFWRAVAFVEDDGSFALGRAAVLDGGREVEVPAPLDELPLFVRAGALLPMLPPDVDTLAAYGAGTPDLVRLDDRRGERRLLAFPRGRSSARLPLGELSSHEDAAGWRLAIDAPNARWTIQASLQTLERPFAPCGVRWQGRALPASQWSYDDERGVLSAVVSGSGELLVRRACT